MIVPNWKGFAASAIWLVTACGAANPDYQEMRAYVIARTPDASIREARLQAIEDHRRAKSSKKA